MTHVRRPGSTEALLLDIIRTTAPAELEAATGLGIGHLRHCSDPNRPYRLAFDTACALDAMLADSGRPAVFLAAARERLSAHRRPALAAAGIADMHAHNQRHAVLTGEHIAQQLRAFEDGTLSTGERRILAESLLARAREDKDMAARIYPPAALTA